MLRWRPALVGVILWGRGVVVRVGRRSRGRGVEGCGLVPAAKLLRGRLTLQGRRIAVGAAKNSRHGLCCLISALPSSLIQESQWTARYA